MHYGAKGVIVIVNSVFLGILNHLNGTENLGFVKIALKENNVQSVWRSERKLQKVHKY